MVDIKRRQRQAKVLRVFRKVHRFTGALLFLFFFFVSVSGLLLGWKKNTGGLILADTMKGTSSELKEWISIDSLHNIACSIVRDSISSEMSLDVERIDVRKDDGIVKFMFTEGFIGIQLDGVSGKLLQIETRRSDYIEKVHDGSIVDHYLGTEGWFKLIYTTIMGIGLLLFTVTGFWLWYGPKKMRAMTRHH